MKQNVQPEADDQLCLIVEDSKVDQIKMIRVVQRSPFDLQPEVASTLEQARGSLRRNRPALILLDNNLPDGLGANFAQEVANDPAHTDIPLIIVSDWPSPFMWEKAASAGVAYVLSKSEFDSRYVHAALLGSFDRTLREQGAMPDNRASPQSRLN